jgi:hypothetical protein
MDTYAASTSLTILQIEWVCLRNSKRADKQLRKNISTWCGHAMHDLLFDNLLATDDGKTVKSAKDRIVG